MTDSPYRPVPLEFRRLPAHEQYERLQASRERMPERRMVRYYACDPVPDALIDRALEVAGSAPSGANLQPWRFVVVRNGEVKRRIREAAEEDRASLLRAPRAGGVAGDVAPLGIDWRKEFLETARA